MVPDLDLQLQVAIKALRDAVVPAVDPSNRAAVEQLHLAIATLAMVRQRLPLAHRFARRQLEDALTLADALSALVPAALTAEAAAAHAALASAEADTAELEAACRDLNEATVAVIARAQDGPARQAIDRAVLRASARPIERGRAWCLPAGFEPDPASVKPIDALL
jgi:hypothetical protein